MARSARQDGEGNRQMSFFTNPSSGSNLNMEGIPSELSDSLIPNYLAAVNEYNNAIGAGASRQIMTRLKTGLVQTASALKNEWSNYAETSLDDILTVPEGTDEEVMDLFQGHGPIGSRFNPEQEDESYEIPENHYDAAPQNSSERHAWIKDREINPNIHQSQFSFLQRLGIHPDADPNQGFWVLGESMNDDGLMVREEPPEGWIPLFSETASQYIRNNKTGKLNSNYLAPNPDAIFTDSQGNEGNLGQTIKNLLTLDLDQPVMQNWLAETLAGDPDHTDESLLDFIGSGINIPEGFVSSNPEEDDPDNRIDSYRAVYLHDHFFDALLRPFISLDMPDIDGKPAWEHENIIFSGNVRSSSTGRRMPLEVLNALTEAVSQHGIMDNPFPHTSINPAQRGGDVGAYNNASNYTHPKSIALLAKQLAGDKLQMLYAIANDPAIKQRVLDADAMPDPIERDSDGNWNIDQDEELLQHYENLEHILGPGTDGNEQLNVLGRVSAQRKKEWDEDAGQFVQGQQPLTYQALLDQLSGFIGTLRNVYTVAHDKAIELGYNNLDDWDTATGGYTQAVNRVINASGYTLTEGPFNQLKSMGLLPENAKYDKYYPMPSELLDTNGGQLPTVGYSMGEHDPDGQGIFSTRGLTGNPKRLSFQNGEVKGNFAKIFTDLINSGAFDDQPSVLQHIISEAQGDDTNSPFHGHPDFVDRTENRNTDSGGVETVVEEDEAELNEEELAAADNLGWTEENREGKSNKELREIITNETEWEEDTSEPPHHMADKIEDIVHALHPDKYDDDGTVVENNKAIRDSLAATLRRDEDKEIQNEWRTVFAKPLYDAAKKGQTIERDAGGRPKLDGETKADLIRRINQDYKDVHGIDANIDVLNNKSLEDLQDHHEKFQPQVEAVKIKRQKEAANNIEGLRPPQDMNPQSQHQLLQQYRKIYNHARLYGDQMDKEDSGTPGTPGFKPSPHTEVRGMLQDIQNAADQMGLPITAFTDDIQKHEDSGASYAYGSKEHIDQEDATNAQEIARIQERLEYFQNPNERGVKEEFITERNNGNNEFVSRDSDGNTVRYGLDAPGSRMTHHQGPNRGQLVSDVDTYGGMSISEAGALPTFRYQSTPHKIFGMGPELEDAYQGAYKGTADLKAMTQLYGEVLSDLSSRGRISEFNEDGTPNPLFKHGPLTMDSREGVSIEDMLNYISPAFTSLKEGGWQNQGIILAGMVQKFEQMGQTVDFADMIAKFENDMTLVDELPSSISQHQEVLQAAVESGEISPKTMETLDKFINYSDANAREDMIAEGHDNFGMPLDNDGNVEETPMYLGSDGVARPRVYHRATKMWYNPEYLDDLRNAQGLGAYVNNPYELISPLGVKSVSYTHLTLPTSDLV